MLVHPQNYDSANGSSTIRIEQTQNGWVVALPYQPYNYQTAELSAVGDDMDPDYEIRRQTRIQKEEFLRDEVLDGLQSQPKKRQRIKLTEIPRVPLIDIKEENIFVFKTFEEVLEFLNKKYIGPSLNDMLT